MKQFLLSLILTLLVGYGFTTPEQLPNFTPNTTLSAIPWKVVAENSEVTIESAYRDKDNTRYVVLRVVNNTNQDITVTFQKRLWYNGNEVNSDNGTITITVPANSSVEGDVYGPDKSLYFFSESLNGRIKSKLTNYEITITN
jgi:hypothetical protein